MAIGFLSNAGADPLCEKIAFPGSLYGPLQKKLMTISLKIKLSGPPPPADTHTHY